MPAATSTSNSSLIAAPGRHASELTAGLAEEGRPGAVPPAPKLRTSPQNLFVKSGDREGGEVCVGKHSQPPSLSPDLLNGVWGLRPQRGPGAEPLAFFYPPSSAAS